MGLGTVWNRLRPPDHRADLALAGGVFLLVAAGSLRSLIDAREESWPVTAFGWLLIAVACGALYGSRRRPVVVAVLVLAVTAVYYLSSVHDGPLMVAVVAALYVVAAQGRLRAAVVIAAVTLLGSGLGTLAGNPDVNGVALFMLAGWLVAVVALGWARYGRLAYAKEVERRAADEERLRVARELHDVIGHQLTMINVQATAALRRRDRDPELVGTALIEIKQAARDSMRELRTTLGILRPPDEPAPMAPAPGPMSRPSPHEDGIRTQR